MATPGTEHRAVNQPGAMVPQWQLFLMTPTRGAWEGKWLIKVGLLEFTERLS